jgi:two-component system cell cycle sensor histidine kinase PleC
MELTDLSQKYAAERTRAAEIGRAKNEFLANMSHELKTPLNAIIGFSEIMQNELYGSIGDDRYRGYAADIYDSGRQLAGLIDDILEMSKIESGRIELNAEDLDLGGLAAECVRLIEPRARDCGVALDNLIIEAPLASGDRRATKRILMNLLSNAVKFTPRGGRIAMTAAEDDKFVTVSIEDNGIGIAEDDLERILAPFEQVEQHHSRSHRGAGLGLAISKALSEMQGGSLKIESTQGVGTKVSLELPHTHALFSGGGGSSELQHVS